MYLIQFTIQYNANRDILKPRDCYRGGGGSGACSPELILSERYNLVSFGDILLRFCLKNYKNIYPLFKHDTSAWWV